MKVNEKIIGSFLLLNFFLGGIGLLSVSFMGKAKNDIVKAVKSEVIEGKYQVKIKDTIQELESNLFAIGWQKEGLDLDRYQERIDKNLIDLDQTINQALNNHNNNLEKLTSEWRKDELEKDQIEDQEEEIESLEDLKQRIIKYKPLIVKYRELLKADNITTAQEVFLTELEPKISNEIDELSGEETEASLGEINETVNEVSEQLNQHQKIIYSTFFIAVIISIILARQISLGIVRPIGKLKESAIRISSGDFDYEINIENKDEIGQLAQCFKQMGIGLKKNTVSKTYLTRILSAITDSLIVTNLKGEIQTVNGVTCKLLQYSEAKLNQDKIQNLLIESNWWKDELSSSDLPQNYQTKYITAFGERITVIFSASFIYDRSGSPSGIVFVARQLDRVDEATIIRIRHKNF